MRNARKIPVGGIIVTAIGALAIGLAHVMKNYVIINYHYRTWVACIWVARTLLIAGVVVLIFGIIRNLIDEHRRKEQLRLQEERKRRISEEQKLKGPEDIERYLRDMRNVENKESVDNLISRIRSMGEYRRRLDQLFKINEMDAFRNIEPAFQQLEEEICEHVLSAINLNVAGGDEYFVASSEKICRIIDQKLSCAQNALLQLAKYTNGQATEDSVVVMINSLVEVLETSRERGEEE